MASTLPNKNHLVTKLKNSFQSANQHLQRTPERSLEQAYQAVLRIKAIENEYFNGGKISTESTNHTAYVISYLRVNLEKNLNIAKLRLVEFRVSSFVLDNLNANHLAKLRLVDEVLDKYKYTHQENNLLPEIRLSEPVNHSLIKANNQSYLPTENAIDVETVTDKTGVLPRSIGRTINKIKSDFNPKKEEEVVRKFRSSRAKTKTAVRFVLTLILVPLLTQQLSKNLLINPIVDRVRVETIPKLFLHSEMKESALRDLQSFEEELK